MDDRRGHIPFERDVQNRGAYQYTSGERLSARIANERYTEMILAAAAFDGTTVVDVGSGDGAYTTELAERSGAQKVLGVEPAASATRKAAERYATVPNLSFECGTSDALLEQGRRFDIAIYRGVIHHCNEAAAEIARALRLAGTIVILEPNGWNPLMKTIEKVSKYHREHGERSYFPCQIARWVREGGGEVQQICYFGMVPYFCPDWMARTGHTLEPLIERVPLLRRFVCGQYLLVARGLDQ